MIKWAKIISEEPTKSQDDNVMAMVDGALRDNAAIKSKWRWSLPNLRTSLLAGTGLMTLLFLPYLWRLILQGDVPAPDEKLAAVDPDFLSLFASDQELLRNLDLIDDLDVLKDWNEVEG